MKLMRKITAKKTNRPQLRPKRLVVVLSSDLYENAFLFR